MNRGVGRPVIAVTEKWGKKSLKDVVGGYSYGKQLYILALQRGMDVQEAVRLAKRYGVEIGTFLIEPEFQGVVEYFKSNQWPVPEEVEELWEKIRAKHFIDRLYEDAEGQLDKDDHKERDKTVIRVAAQHAIMLSGKGEVLEGQLDKGDYDEIILKRHREYAKQDGAVE